jgi:hypothetical protein
MKRTLALLLLVFLAFAQEEQLSYLQEANLADFSTNSLITAFAAKQGEILRKVFTHYTREQIHRWESSDIGPQVIRAKVLDLVVGRRDDLYRELKAFVEDRLFAKLGKQLTS